MNICCIDGLPNIAEIDYSLDEFMVKPVTFLSQKYWVFFMFISDALECERDS